MATKWVYMFKEGDATMRNLLGGKGANLAEMTNLGLPVPQTRKPPTIARALDQVLLMRKPSAMIQAPQIVMKNPTALGYTKAANIIRGTHVAIRTVNAP